MAQEKKEVKEKFVYVFGDVSKTPVDFAAQPQGTRCVLVTPGGLEYEVVSGVSRLGTEPSPELLERIERSKGWDSKDEKFPNLKIPRES